MRRRRRTSIVQSSDHHVIVKILPVPLRTPCSEGRRARVELKPTLPLRKPTLLLLRSSPLPPCKLIIPLRCSGDYPPKLSAAEAAAVSRTFRRRSPIRARSRYPARRRFWAADLCRADMANAIPCDRIVLRSYSLHTAVSRHACQSVVVETGNRFGIGVRASPRRKLTLQGAIAGR